MSNQGLVCIVCEEDFCDARVPRNLGCGHSVCTDCTDQIILVAAERRCPECREPFTASRASDLKVNFPLLRLTRSVISLENNSLADSSDSTAFKTESIAGKTIFIDDYGSGPLWRENSSQFTCSVTSPKIQSECYGMRKQVAYTVLPSFSSKRVLRKYQQFEWLHNQLALRYPLIILPQLPESQVLGTFKEEFLKNRTCKLQSWIDRVCRHPVLSQSNIFKLFITISNKKSWKASKRKENNGRLPREDFYYYIELQDSSMDMAQMKQRLEEHNHFVNKLGKSLKLLQNTSRFHADNFKTICKQDNDKISSAFMKLSQAFKTDITYCGQDLPVIVQHVSEAYTDIGDIHEVEYGKDWISLKSLLLDYQSLAEGFNLICSVAGKSIKKWGPQGDDESRKELDTSAVTSGANVTIALTPSKEAKIAAYVLQAETAYFHQQRAREFKESLTAFLIDQIDFYHKITERLRESLQRVLSVGADEPSAPPFEL